MKEEKRIFLMLIPEFPTLNVARQFQEALNQKYNLYQILPDLHITLESILLTQDSDIEVAKKVIQEVTADVKPFTIAINGFACFGPPFKSVHLHVVKSKPLEQVYQRIHTALKEAGLSVREYEEGIDFHITIASSCFPGRDWSEEEYHQACEEVKKLPLETGFLPQVMELWYPDLDQNARLIARFPLCEN